MIIRKLQIENFRNLRNAAVEPHERLNFFHGANGAGKTSVLESLVVLSRGRSFRTTQASELIGPEDATFRVFVIAEDGTGPHRLGLERSGRRWRGRRDGADLSQLSHLTRSLPLVLMEPDSHLLVSGPPEVRRRFLDWGLFHVEPAFLEVWRQYSKALKQRNAALRRKEQRILDSLDVVLARYAQELNDYREAHCAGIAGGIAAMLHDLGGGFSGVSLRYFRGWSAASYLEDLKTGRARDLERGVTSHGPHRADLLIQCGSNPARAVLSRGEQKMLAASLLFTQAELLSATGETPLLLLDDLSSEFDRVHLDCALQRALALGGQVWVTGTQEPGTERSCAVFHVERGEVRKVV